MPNSSQAYITTLKSPIGTVAVGYQPKTVLCIHIGSSPRARVQETLACLGFQPSQETHPTGKKIETELQDYFRGKRRRFSLKPKLFGTPFQVKVWDILYRVPYGEVITYGELAAEAGRPNAARAVGMIMGQNRIPLIVPCHRVISAHGKLGGFGCGLDVKRKLLKLEGIDL